MHTLSGIELRDKFLKKEFSAVSIVTAFLDRISQYDGQIGAFLTVFSERALAKAKTLDAKLASGHAMGKLAAIPIAIKDNIHLKGEITTCASKFLINYRATFDATATQLIEAEDAIIIGKTNMDEFAMGSSNETSAIQMTYNPWNLKCIPGGSSGGSAAAVAARLCPISFGSDTGGSIRQPAALCGIVGYKPTYGRVSRYGLVALGSSWDQIGPFTTTVKDAALVMEVIGQHCEKDSTSLISSPDVYSFSKNLKGIKIGVPYQFLEGLQEDQRELFNKSLTVLKELGSEIVDVDLSILKYSIAVYYIISTAEASTNLARFDGIRYGVRSPKAKTLDEVYEFSKEEGFGPEVKRRILLGTYVLSSGFQDAYYKKAQKVRTLMIQHCNEAFKKCDLIAMPTSPFAAFEAGSIKDPLQMYLADIYTIAANLAGIPSISVPGGFTKDCKPIGFQLMGAQKCDVRVMQGAYAYEQATKHTAIPKDFV